MLVCCNGRWRLVCYLDNLNHAVLRRLRVRRLCDIHDLHLVEMSEECPQACDPDCEIGPEHCVNIHLPSHKRSHGPATCPASR